MNDEIESQLRAMLPEDLSFIFNSWMEKVRNQFPNYFIYEKIFNKKQTDIIRSLIEKSLIIVACNTKNKDQIFGYICYEKVEGDVIIHMCYVKNVFRGFGIGQKLIYEAYPEFGREKSIITFLPEGRDKDIEPEGRYKDIERTISKYRLFYNPYLLRTKE